MDFSPSPSLILFNGILIALWTVFSPLDFYFAISWRNEIHKQVNHYSWRNLKIKPSESLAAFLIKPESMLQWISPGNFIPSLPLHYIFGVKY